MLPEAVGLVVIPFIDPIRRVAFAPRIKSLAFPVTEKLSVIKPVALIVKSPSFCKNLFTPPDLTLRVPLIMLILDEVRVMFTLKPDPSIPRINVSPAAIVSGPVIVTAATVPAAVLLNKQDPLIVSPPSEMVGTLVIFPDWSELITTTSPATGGVPPLQFAPTDQSPPVAGNQVFWAKTPDDTVSIRHTRIKRIE